MRIKTLSSVLLLGLFFMGAVSANAHVAYEQITQHNDTIDDLPGSGGGKPRK